MKSIVIALSKILLTGGILLLLVLLFSPIQYEIPDLKPLEKDEDSEISGSEVLIPETKKENESMVAMLFGWVAPRRTLSPQRGPVVTPAPPLEPRLRLGRAVIEEDGISFYWIRNISTGSGFWLPEKGISDTGYRFVQFIPEGVIVLYENQQKIIRK